MNMRKIIAVLAAMLMLCSIIPMGAMVSAAALVDYDFEDGSLGSWKYDTTNDTLEVVDGAMKWTTISWKNTYLNFKATANTDYKLTIRAKADVNATVDVKFLNGSWGTSGIEKTTQTYTTEWAEYTYIFNSLEYGGLVLLFQSHKATTIYYDSVKIETYVAPKDPEFPENAIYTETFENGSLNGWTSNCSVVSTAGLAATNAEGGNYCLEFISPNYSYTNYKMTNLEKNTDYVVTFSILSATSGYPINARVRDSAGDLGYVQYTPSITAWETHSYLFNSGNNTSANLRFQAAWTTGTYYIDNISVAPIDLSAVANDGHIMNGNFESGNNLGWNASANTTIVADPTGAGQGYVIKTFETGNSVDMFTQEFKNLVAGKTYTLSFKVYGYGSATNNVFFIRVPKDVTFSNPTGIATSDSGKTYVARFNMNANTGKWITVTLDFVAASSTALIQFQNYRTDQGFYYFDDITLSHAYDATVTDPDCVNGGYTTYTCACGATYTDNATDALGHSYVDGICGVCGAEDPNYEPPHTCNVVEQDRVDATCTTDGYIKYACDCGLGEYIEPILAKGHTWDDATCTTPKTCSVCGATEGEALDHTYANDFDTNCDNCGAIREIKIQIYEGKSASEDVAGLAFRFNVKALNARCYDLDGLKSDNIYEVGSATIIVNGEEYSLKCSGAVVSNKQDIKADELTITNAQNNGNKSIKNIGAKFLWDMTATSITYAVRVINIPEANWDTVISARPYYTYANADGDSITVYGDVVTGTYNNTIG